MKPPSLPPKVAIIGAGAWGTALAAHAARLNLAVSLWAYEPEVADQINRERINQVFLPGVRLPGDLTASNDLGQVLEGQKLALMVVPSHILRAVAARMAPFLAPEALVISASKGIEEETSATMVQILEEELRLVSGLELGALSGPSFAREVALGLPTAVTLAMRSSPLAQAAQALLSASAFRIYTSQDLVGVELGGALKNVYAIAAGICEGFGLGLNARAAMLPRALSEMTRMAVAKGANPMTLAGLSGMGDLVLTATVELSRNRQVGFRLGRGEKLADIVAGRRDVAEGIHNARSVHGLAQRHHVEMPMAREVYRVLYEDKEPLQGLAELLNRPLKAELD